MDLTGLLEKLRSLFTPAFLISSVTPLFCFFLVNGAILGQYNHTVRQWVGDFYLSSSASKTVNAAIISIVLLMVAYVFSTLNLILLETLQGKHLPKWFEKRFRTGENARLDSVTNQWIQAKNLRRGLTNPVTVKVKVKVEQPQSKSDLPNPASETARPNGETIKTNVVQDQELVLPTYEGWQRQLDDSYEKEAPPTSCNFGVENPAHQSLHALGRKQSEGALIMHEELKEAFDQLAGALTTNSAVLPGNAGSNLLQQDIDRLKEVIIYAVRKSEDEYIRSFNEKEFDFSRYTVAPTRMGNVAESIRSYALSRYGMNLDFFWPRLQKALQGRSEFYQTIQNAKTQLDFTVSLFWLTLASTVLWLILLPFVSRTWLPLFGVWFFGPALAIMWYRMGVQNYRSFAGLLRSCIDLFRFELLIDLKIPLPQDSQIEQQTWDRLNHWISYGEDSFVAYKAD